MDISKKNKIENENKRVGSPRLNKIKFVDEYEKLGKLGKNGKEGITYLVKTKSGEEYAMKTFKKQKSSKRLLKESGLQEIASEAGIAPKIITVDAEQKYIVMEKMGKHLVEYMKKQNGNLTEIQQRQIIKLFKALDKAGVFHGDSNILNYMYNGRRLYMIDFGMAKEITPALIRKLGTKTPNIDIMTLGLIIKLKELKCPETSFSHLSNYVSKKQMEYFML